MMTVRGYIWITKKVKGDFNKCKSAVDIDIEDEFHFVLKCPLYSDLRKKYIKPFYYKKPSVFKLVLLLSTQNIKELCNLGKCLYTAFEIRNTLV